MTSKLDPDTLEEVARSAAEEAPRVDKEGAFPAATIEALRERGFLGLISSAEVGGRGGGFRDAIAVVERIARECGSSGMVLCMHYCAAAVIEAHGERAVRMRLAQGELLGTLAFSESGSRSHFWAPLSTARRDNGSIVLDADKSWVTSARHADIYVWSSRALSTEGQSTLWLVGRELSGLSHPGGFDGLGLRGNDSLPVRAQGVRVREQDRLGNDGQGFQIMMGVALPWFSLLNAACSVGLMEAMVRATTAHVSGTRFAHLGSSLAELPTIRAYLARMRLKTDMMWALLRDAAEAVTTARADASLRVLEAKAGAGETSNEVGDLAMRVCGGAAFRRDVAVERNFRDARAATIMAPTTDALYDFMGKALTGQELF